ncbi:hypothetical protein RUE5091_03616 [Ruegeria denitrificans]|uniref:Uncharacterized protein n=1 Tax=Ruegeria denitrificans TaxID=1715692 RepID=A0A0P1IHD4_9RHOB|nr:hypothetical protein [Ruegeria denitrificans]CUK13116.1 hypothetical protein RUE5091_03616 [Ruegeria denitrificans]
MTLISTTWISGFLPLVGILQPVATIFRGSDRLPYTSLVPQHRFTSPSGVADMQAEIKHNGQNDRTTYKIVHKNTKIQSDTSK